MKVPDSRIIAAFQTHWQRLGAGSVPAREQFDPLDLPLILPNLLLVELEPETERLRYRLVGTLADEYTGFNLKGVYMDELFGTKTDKSARFFDKIYRRIGRSGVPEGGTYQWPSPKGLSMHVAFAVFPFTSDGAIRQFFCIEDYTEIYGADVTSPPWSVAPLAMTSPSPLPKR